jgi:hypothetical protein
MVSKVRTDGYSVGRPCGIKLSAQRVVYAARGTWLWGTAGEEATRCRGATAVATVTANVCGAGATGSGISAWRIVFDAEEETRLRGGPLR